MSTINRGKKWVVGLAIVTVLFGVSLAWVPPAAADDPSVFTFWSMAAQGCVIEPGSAGKLVHDETGGVRFRGSATGTAYVSCPVAVFTYSAEGCGKYMYLGLTSADPDNNLNNFVRAWLNVLSVHTATVGTYAKTTSTAHGQAFDSSPLLGHLPGFDANYYYVVVEMHRSSPTANVVFYGTLLQSGAIC
jgi:hypothetical protein